ncbi:MAG: peptidase S8, partial [Bacteroidetes bacterium]|nr:peptidase S8 [Bacteroidota bacterium]
MFINKYLISSIILMYFSFSVIAQNTINWYNGEGTGMYTEAAYKLVKKKKSTTVTVAVIDSGIDIEHEDLQGKIWVNPKEIAGNGKDDDGNGYIDDIHGWNFLGNEKGENIDATRLEKTRIFAELRDKYEGVDATLIEQDEEYALYLKVAEEVGEQYRNMQAEYEQYKAIIDLTPEYKKYYDDNLKYNLNPDYDDRSLIGDNPNDINDRKYGNNNYEGPDALHGTHVAGIIGAVRGNGKGGDGVASDVKIMSIRAVPNGDEHDKDVALAIRYAVDNGAQVVNMSFGKAYSPNSEWVCDAIQYADSKGVLLVHAAGNDNKNIDIEPNFPAAKYSFQTVELKNFLTIGASTNDIKVLKAEFSNFGISSVDIFAPGQEIYSTVPDNQYKNLQGTSMAAPMVSGAAAFLK